MGSPFFMGIEKVNEKTLHILEYDKIIARLTDMAHSVPGKEKCKSLLPMTDYALIDKSQAETADAAARILRVGKPSFQGNRNLAYSLNALSLGSSLSATELIHIAEEAECASRVKNYGKKEHADDPDDTLTSYFDGIELIDGLKREIRRCLISEEEVADDASATLKNIRRSKITINDRIHTQLNQMVNTTYRTYLQDAVITMRNNRYCIPVKAEYKNTVSGMIHDQSKAGSTFFIEPAQIVEYNNKLVQLDAEEKEEIERILATLSAEAAQYTNELEADCKVLTTLDFIFAKAALALSMNAAKPEYIKEHFLEIRKARHPFLDAKKAVPIDIKLGENYKLLIITGPNTGGKTVSLKTTGLLCAMGQSGLHIPASSTSKLCIFRDIYADIGDEQSIEQSLSTFSAHTVNIISILKNADEECLCLFDELCAGTDPTEGAALAIAILRSLKNKGVLTMATTHFSELKLFALSEPGAENAGCEFDVETLSPTYRLLIGIPGKSNAFAISKKLGLPEEIIEDAKGEITQSQESFEDLLSDLEKSRKELEKKEIEIENNLSEITRVREQLKQKETALEEKKSRIIREANEEAKDILQDAKDTADAAIRSYHKGGDIREMEETRASLRKKINEKAARTEERSAKTIPGKPVSASELKVGDFLEIVSMQFTGHLKKLPDPKGNIILVSGNMEIRTNIKDVRFAKDDSEKEQKKSLNNAGSYLSKFSKSATISPEINLLGKNADEAVAALDKYLDDAYLSHLKSVRVVHGKGTGVLRDAVQRHLRTLSYVKSFRQAEYGEGDAGVTIVEFK